MTHSIDFAPELTLSIEDLFDQKTTVLAKSGSGKSYLGGVIVEEFLEANLFPTIILDPTGVWWGLRASAKGEPNGYPVLILGGSHGDAPLDAESGVSVAKFLCEQRVSAILDFSHLSPTATRQFGADFLSTVYATQLKIRQPIYLVVDEADEFAPEAGSKSGGYIAQSLNAMLTIIRRGRTAGIGAMLLTQRSAVISKDAISQTDVMFALHTTMPHDINAVKSWLEKASDAETVKKAIDALPKMKPASGQAIAYAPTWDVGLQRIKVRKKRTFDSGATPKLDSSKAPVAKLAEIDIPKFTGNLQKAVERAKAEDPKHLQAKIVELQRELEKAKTAQPEPVVQGPSDEELDDMIDHAKIGRDAQWFDWLAETADLTLGQAVGRLQAIVDERKSPFPPHTSRIGEELPEIFTPPRPQMKLTPPQLEKTRTAIAEMPEPVPRRAPSNGKVNLRSLSSEDRILAVLKQFPDGATDRKIAGRACIVRKKSTYRNALTKLRKQELIVDVGHDARKLTGKGLAATKHLPSLPPPGKELLDYWRDELGGVPLEIFEYLEKAGGRWVEKAKLAEDLGRDPTVSTVRNALTTLGTFDLIERQGSRLRLNQEIVVG